MKGMRNDHPTNQRVGMKRSGIRPLQLLDGMHGRVLTLFVVEVLQPAFFSEALFLRVPVPCQKGADITLPPSVSFCLTRRRSEGANEERDGREHSTPPLAMSFPPPPPSPCVSADRYAAVGGAMEVWINLTTAWSNRGRMRERKRAWDGVQTRKKGAKNMAEF